MLVRIFNVLGSIFLPLTFVIPDRSKSYRYPKPYNKPSGMNHIFPLVVCLIFFQNREDQRSILLVLDNSSQAIA